ncbi:LysR substrate-binding domain-containing protein [Massilia sp. 2TAF26]|uniref:LysR substrate-binding domain-containing protein n=1 Tax=Massilia sp. 2TAF26 TaxID=3233012 RepID=UPI003F9943D4
MDLKRLRYFVTTAEELHVARAAERLGIAQPALSQQLRVLEETLGTRLFERAGRGIRLSAVGAVFLPEARATLRQAEQAQAAVHAAARGQLGRLEIGYVASAMLEDDLPQLLHTFQRTYPEVRLHVRRMPVLTQLRAVLERKLDLAFVRGVGPAHGIELDDQLRGQVLSVSEVLVALPLEHPCAAQERVAIADLAREQFLVLQDSEEPGYFAHCTERLCRLAGFEPHVALRVDELVSLTGLVAAGLGVCLVPSSIRRIAGDRVVLRPLVDTVERLELLMVRHRDAQAPALLNLLSELSLPVAQQRSGRGD